MTSYLSLVQDLQSQNVPYVLATVINVKGSASARPGSKAIIKDGKNIFGWVGGGCAESFVIKNALEALELGQTRIIQADLDDEIFGLGMPCGGIMDVYLEPHLPKEKILIKGPSKVEESVLHFARSMNFDASFEEGLPSIKGPDLELAFYSLAEAIATQRGVSFSPLKDVRNVFPEGTQPKWNGRELSELLIVGSSRITEELARLGAMLRWKTRVYGWNLDPALYPASTVIEESDAGFENFKPLAGSAVMIASHHKGDHEFIRQSTEAEALYVGLIASTKRSGLILNHLNEMGLGGEKIARVRAPAGLELVCKNPTEIALSCVAEILRFKNE